VDPRPARVGEYEAHTLEIDGGPVEGERQSALARHDPCGVTNLGDHSDAELLAFGVIRIEVPIVEALVPAVGVDVGAEEAVVPDGLLQRAHALHAVTGIDAVETVD